MSTAGDFYEPVVYGTNRKPLRYGISDDAGRVRWASGSIQIFDAETGRALPGFAAPVACFVSSPDVDGSVWLVWWPVFGTGSGELRPISADRTYLVQWTGIDEDGGSEVTEKYPWTLKAA